MVVKMYIGLGMFYMSLCRHSDHQLCLIGGHIYVDE